MDNKHYEVNNIFADFTKKVRSKFDSPYNMILSMIVIVPPIILLKASNNIKNQ